MAADSSLSLRFQLDSQVLQETPDETRDDAVRLRQWDDQAKVPGQKTPPLERFSDMIDSVLLTDETN